MVDLSKVTPEQINNVWQGLEKDPGCLLCNNNNDIKALDDILMRAAILGVLAYRPGQDPTAAKGFCLAMIHMGIHIGVVLEQTSELEVLYGDQRLKD